MLLIDWGILALAICAVAICFAISTTANSNAPYIRNTIPNYGRIFNIKAYQDDASISSNISAMRQIKPDLKIPARMVWAFLQIGCIIPACGIDVISGCSQAILRIGDGICHISRSIYPENRLNSPVSGGIVTEIK